MDNKLAFVVGGLGLIGKEVSWAFSSAGAKIIILDVNEKEGRLFSKKMQKKGLDVVYKYFDCSDLDKIENSFSRLITNNGTPNILINCSYPRTDDWGKSSFKEIMFSSFRKNVDIHMNSYAWISRLGAETMKGENNSGNIIHLGSIYGVVGQDYSIYEGTNMQGNMTYAAIKGGIINLTRQMASYYGQFNIRVNTICPGGLKGHNAGVSDVQEETFLEQYSSKVPLKRLGNAEEIASTALFLASDAASYITGATLMVDGGWTAI